MNKGLLALAIVMSFGLAGCGSDASLSSEGSLEYAGGDSAADLSDADTLLRAIRQELGNPQARSADQCRVVGIGHRPCGGPERYLLYSVDTTDERRLLGLVERYNAQARESIEESGVVGTCEALPQPGTILRGGVCVAAPMAEM